MVKLALAITVILCMGLLGAVGAQEPPPTQQPPPAEKKAQKPDKPAEKSAAKAHAGEVVSIDQTKNEIVIKDESGTETRLVVSQSTKITKAGNTISLADLKAGDKLTFECEGKGEGCTAKSIQVTTSPQDN